MSLIHTSFANHILFKILDKDYYYKAHHYVIYSSSLVLFHLFTLRKASRRDDKNFCLILCSSEVSQISKTGRFNVTKFQDRQVVTCSTRYLFPIMWLAGLNWTNKLLVYIKVTTLHGNSTHLGYTTAQSRMKIHNGLKNE